MVKPTFKPLTPSIIDVHASADTSGKTTFHPRRREEQQKPIEEMICGTESRQKGKDANHVG